MSSLKKYIYFSLLLYFFFALFLSINGYFQIGWLSDDYYDFNDAANSNLAEKFTGHLPNTNNLHLRPIYYLSLQVSKSVHDLLGYGYDNFIFYRFQNLIVYLLLVFIAGLIVLRNTNRPDIALIASAHILIYPNNLNNICRTAGRDDIILTVFSLLSIYYAYKDDAGKYYINLLLSSIFLILALLTKETAIVLPFVILFLLYIEYGYSVFKIKKSVYIYLIIFLTYVIYKFSLNQLKIPGHSFFSTVTTFFEILISLIVPFDYLSIRTSFFEFNLTILIYITLLVIIFVFFTTNLGERKKTILQGVVLFLLLIIPDLIAGNFMPRLILFPFAIMTIYIVSKVLYNYNFKGWLKKINAYFFIAVIFMWTVTASETVSQWNTSYKLARESVLSALSVSFDFRQKNVIIGQPGRVKQTFMFDKITGPYNYFRYYDSVIKDTLYDIVLLGSLNNESISSPLSYKRINSDEFDIQVNNEHQYFYVLGFDDKKFSQGIISNGVLVRSLELNSFGKVKKIKVRKLEGNIILYIYIKDYFLKIF